MKLKLMILSAATAVMLSITAASAVTVTVLAVDQPALDSLDPTKSLDLGGGFFDTARTTVAGNLANIYRSPWEGDADFQTTRFYTSGPTGAPNQPNPAVLKFASAQDNLTFLWGSVDTYNILNFKDSSGSLIVSVVGQDILDLGATARLGASLVSFTGFSQAFSQVEFFSNLSNAFEFSNISVIPSAPPPSVVPLPAALPLYGTGLALMAYIGWRRKRKTA